MTTQSRTTQSRLQPTHAELALQQAYRTIALSDADRQAAAERERVLAEEVVRLRALIEDWFKPHVSALEHANAYLRRRCRDAETALARNAV